MPKPASAVLTPQMIAARTRARVDVLRRHTESDLAQLTKTSDAVTFQDVRAALDACSEAWRHLAEVLRTSCEPAEESCE
ncbi:MAG: hypothetical protein ACTHLN_01660 [Tepidisphaeraceae bacterium]